MKMFAYRSALCRLEGKPCWRASEASETLSGVYKFELVRYVYICICNSTGRSEIRDKFHEC